MRLPLPSLFFAKICLICALGLVAALQGYSLFRRDATVTKSASPDATTRLQTGVESKNDGHPLAKTREQVRRELAEMVSEQREKLLQKRPKKPPLHVALADEETYGLIKSAIIRRLDEPYGKLYRHLGLDADSLQTLRGLLAEKELALLEGYELAREAKTFLDSDSLNALRNETDGIIRELVGDVAFSYYKEYESTLGTRNYVDVLEKRLSYKTEQLASAQYDALVAALSQLPDPKTKSGSEAWMWSHCPETTVAMLEVAKNILTPSQYAIYEADYENTNFSNAIKREYSKIFANAEKEHRANIKAKLIKGDSEP